MPTPGQALYWVAEYADGTGLPQYDPLTGEENRYGEIDRSRLVALHLRPFDEPLARLTGNLCNPFLPTYTMPVKDGEELIYYRHTEVTYGMEGPALQGAQIIWQALGIKGKFCLQIDQDGNVIAREAAPGG